MIFLWGRDLNSGVRNNRISSDELCTQMQLGGFGMIDFKDVIDGIRCKQLGKMYGNTFTHPLKQFIVDEDNEFSSGTCLIRGADSVAISAHNLPLIRHINYVESLTNDQIRGDKI
jgi:hypothetical protein